MIRVLVVASSPGARERLARSLRATSRFEVVAVSGGARPHREDLVELEPDVVVADVASDDRELGREVLEWAAAGEAVILVAEDFASGTSRGFLRSGVKAVLPGGVTERELGPAVEAVAAGLIVLAPDQVERLSSPPSLTASDGEAAFAEALTSREVEVLRLVAEGMANKEVAARLAISEHTAKFHVASILGKLGAASRTEAVTAGIRRGLIII
jgi:two-component system, NarL family, response regulator YdfI